MIHSVKTDPNQAKEAEDNLHKTQEELHMVMMAPPPPPPPPMYDHLEDNSDSEENASTHSADLQMQDINDHRNEEERLTEAEKNERVQKQLKVRAERCRVASFPVALLEARRGALPWPLAGAWVCFISDPDQHQLICCRLNQTKRVTFFLAEQVW